MEKNIMELGGNLSNQSTISTSLDSIDLDGLNVELAANVEWLSKIVNDDNTQDISEKILSITNIGSKLISTFYKSKCILSNKFYLSKDKNNIPELLSVINLGSNIESHPNVVHGGFSATIVDNCFGILAHQIFKFPVTKTLNLSYKKPIQPSSTIIVISKLKDTENGESPIRGNRATLVSEIYDINRELLISSEAIFVDISDRMK
ncbi:hypothetical protein FG379_000764 [Cryptosporidium bovis]|uniref:uncharacterized protein n=1 Tax=Cryptosporidium bovis TaxID=310047 RepID=UPI003519F0FC|nr:hypothetical protein FG379_000764 [Cryptosporidium bovis]